MYSSFVNLDILLKWKFVEQLMLMSHCLLTLFIMCLDLLHIIYYGILLPCGKHIQMSEFPFSCQERFLLVVVQSECVKPVDKDIGIWRTRGRTVRRHFKTYRVDKL